LHFAMRISVILLRPLHKGGLCRDHMPRTARELHPDGFYHIVNRGNNQQPIFRKDLDYHVFLSLLMESKQRNPVPVFGYCLMPNHFHLLLRVNEQSNIPRFIHWAMTCFAGYSHRQHQTSGHLWQARYKSFPVDNERYLVAALRYIEGNPVRAELVPSCIDWPWSSARAHLESRYAEFVEPPPILLPRDWVKFVDTPLTVNEMKIMKKAHQKMKRGQSPPGGTVPLIL